MNAKKKILIKLEPKKEDVIELYKEAKRIYKNAEKCDCVDLLDEQRLQEILTKFAQINNKKGVAFVKKSIAIINEIKADNDNTLHERIVHYEIAHDSINEIATLPITYVEPSIVKRRAVLKSKLGSCLHQTGQHQDANLLESDAAKLFQKIQFEFPDYPEARLENATASFRKIRWTLTRIQADLETCAKQFSKPTHTKHLPEEWELKEYFGRISNLKSTIQQLSNIINSNSCITAI